MTTASARLENDEYVELEVLELLEDPKVQAIISKISNESGRKGAAEAFNMLKEEAHNAEKQTPTKTGKDLWSSTKTWVVNHKKAVFIVVGLVTAGVVIYSLKPGSHAQEDELDLLGEQADMSEAMGEL